MKDCAPAIASAIDRAFLWFQDIEHRCSRFDPASELMQLTRTTGTPVAVSEALFHAVHLAVTLAEQSGGAFDPTVGLAMAARGFNRHHRTDEAIDHATLLPCGQHADAAMTGAVSYRDVVCDDTSRTVCLQQPLVLDLGAVAKGLAVDLAAQELQAFRNFAIDAGGDLYLSGTNAEGQPWSVGIRHPTQDHELIDVLTVSDAAVCTSGNYERAEGGHILDPRTGQMASTLASSTVVAPTAMLADAAATAAFVLGLEPGLRFCQQVGVEALMITRDLVRHETPDLRKQ